MDERQLSSSAAAFSVGMMKLTFGNGPDMAQECASGAMTGKGKAVCAKEGRLPAGQPSRRRRYTDWGKLFLKLTDVGDEVLDVRIAQAFSRLHLDGLAILDAFLDRLEGFVVLQLVLVFGGGHVFRAGFLAHLRVAFAVGAV